MCVHVFRAGMVCAFVTNELLREQTSKDSKEALIPKVAAGIRQFDAYLLNTATVSGPCYMCQRSKVLGVDVLISLHAHITKTLKSVTK